MDQAIEQVTPQPALLEISSANRAVATGWGIVPAIHQQDFIFRFVEKKWQGDYDRAVLNYYELGRYSADLARRVLDDVMRTKKMLKEDWYPRRVLDFASGYGGTSRHLAVALTDSLISTCDIHAEAVAFNAGILGLTSHVSSSVPERLEVPEQDAIFAMSFFSHMPNATYVRWLQALARALAPGGVLVFTANGHVTDKLGLTGVEVEENGFGFRPQSEQQDLEGGQYGITISYPRWVFRALEQCPELRLARFEEGFWWSVQDTYVCVRRWVVS